MNDRQWEVLMQSLWNIEQLLEGPPKDATCEGCRWYKEVESGRPKSGRCVADGMKYAGDDQNGTDWWFYSPTDKSDLCRHWRAKP